MSKEKAKNKNSWNVSTALRKVGGGLMILVAPAAIAAGFSMGVSEAKEKPAETPLEVAEDVGNIALKTIGFGLPGLFSAYLGIELLDTGNDKKRAIMSSESDQKQKAASKPAAQAPEATVATAPEETTTEESPDAKPETAPEVVPEVAPETSTEIYTDSSVEADNQIEQPPSLSADPVEPETQLES